ncbi:SagB-type dehydrogenase family enzyme [Oikeobacillus pervagus]|uniref:SagB-type dehydrogenase family enzyme n=1 Tax=Oikeobacillus pervagus TaxID=1325931 RepID=A0AAJ1T574_9BACI|nr:SagB family peptide dehydrogenase [Oikeobacillus pervagus]MDQ0216069.1 SagB-type dehydrogenase family enzyme [Oikeobacillus pervagus]
MKLEEFVHNLHFDIEKVNPLDWEVNWDDAPLPYKLYRGLPFIPLSLEVPLSLEEMKVPTTPNLQRIGHLLWYVFGLTQFSQSICTIDSKENMTDLFQSFRRFVPSGGALYPNELYVYLKLKDLPDGLYHYDVAHHNLVLLRKGNFDSYIERALGHGCDISSCFGTVFVTTMFWKNFFKYNHFSYRLQGLDAGVLIGQLLEVSKRFGFASGVYFQFLDRALNHLIGLPEQEESVYAVIPLSVEPTNWSPKISAREGDVTAKELSQELTAIHHQYLQRSQKIVEYPLITKMNEASMLESTHSFQKIQSTKEKMGTENNVQALPNGKQFSTDLASFCRERFSPEMDFVLGKVSKHQLATLLQEATSSFTYRNDLEDAHTKNEPRVSIYGCFYNVKGIANGAYSYDSTAHSLRQINLGDHRLQLQNGMTGHNVNLIQVPICLHVVGNKDYIKTRFGYRGYRIQQMEAGMLIQRLLIAAATLGMGGHPLLGFDAKLCDDIYKLDTQEKTSLIQIPIGPYRDRPWLRGTLHS